MVSFSPLTKHPVRQDDFKIYYPLLAAEVTQVEQDII